MKNDSQPVVTSGTTTSSRSKKMGIHEENLGDIMSILTNMYGDAYEATLREYAANGYDSHVAAGVDAPVEVTLPTPLSPALLIQDHGLGLSGDDLMDTFSVYGKSTKKDTNSEVGGFGIGAKSAFTMGSQFIVSGVKDGLLTVAKFSMGEDGVPETELMHENVPTDKPNGVLISLAVEDIDRMKRTARKVFSTWPVGSVVVDGEEPESVFARGFDVNSEVTLVKEHTGKVYATLGPVAYPVTSEQLDQVVKVLGEDPAAEVAQVLARWDSDHGTSVFFRAEVGAMTVAPTREGLRDTRKTINALAAMITGLHQDLTASVQARLDACSSSYAAAREFKAAQDDIAPLKVSRKSVHFAGLEGFKQDVQVNLPKYSIGSKGYNYRTFRNSTAIVVQEFESFTFDVNTADKVLVVTEVPEGEESTVKRYVKRFIENTEGVDHVLVTPATGATYGGWFTFGEGVVDGAKCMTRTEYRAALKAMRATAERTSNEPSYSTGVGAVASRDLDERDLLSDIISWGKDIVVFEGRAPRGKLVEEVLADYTPVVLLATQSEAALLKRIEADGSVNVVEVDVQAEVRKIAQERMAQISADERAALGAVRWLDENSATRPYGPVVEWKKMNTILENHAIGTLPEWVEISEAIELAELVAADISEDRRKELSVLANALDTQVTGSEFDFEIPTIAQVYPMLAMVDTYRLTRGYQENLLTDVAEYLFAKHN